MKLSRWLILLLALLSAGLLTGANFTILDTARQVSVEREVLAGDPDAAAGVELTLPLTCSDQLFWTTTFPAGKPEEAETGFAYTLSQTARFRRVADTPLSVEIAGPYYWGNTPDSPYPLLDSFTRQAQETIPAGTEATVPFRVRDYLDTWPLHVTADLPGLVSGQAESSSLQGLFQDYFAIPVPDDAVIMVTVYDGGGSFSYDSGCVPRMSSYAASRGDAILFVLSNTATVRNEEGQSVPVRLDGSAIPGGWGLYRYTPGADGGAGRLETLWSLPEGAEILEFWGAENESDFFLLTREEGQLRLRVFDGDGNLCQSMDLLPLSQEESYMQTYQGEDFFVPMVYGPRAEGYCYRFPVMYRQPEGWALAFTGDDRQAKQLGCGGFSWAHDAYSGLDMAFDGTRLAIRDSSYFDSDPFWLAVYSRDGLDYLASYRSSIPQAADSSGIRLFWPGEPLVRWAETGS